MSDRLLMHMGPCVPRRDVLEAGVDVSAGFASPETILATQTALLGLRTICGASDRMLPVLIPGSGTSAMESITTLLRKGDRVLVLSNGVFGNRWRSIFQRYPVQVDVIEAEPGETVVEEVLQGRTGYRMVCMTHVETSTGVRADIRKLSRRAREVCEIVVVDAVASAGGEKIEMDDWGIDVLVTASQKGLGASPGLGIVLLREELLETADNLAPFYNNLKNWGEVSKAMINVERKYFATPPIQTVLSLSRSVRLTLEEGMEKRIERHRRVAELIRKGVEELNMSIVASEHCRSNTVTAVRLQHADSFVEACMKHGVEIATGVHPALAGRYFRVGHMGWITEEHASTFLEVAAKALKEMSVK
ncbi:MAG: alanine--glyoxylate aminotransferase family protein [Methanomassiliicoccales archaeon]